MQNALAKRYQKPIVRQLLHEIVRIYNLVRKKKGDTYAYRKKRFFYCVFFLNKFCECAADAMIYLVWQGVMNVLYLSSKIFDGKFIFIMLFFFLLKIRLNCDDSQLICRNCDEKIASFQPFIQTSNFRHRKCMKMNLHALKMENMPFIWKCIILVVFHYLHQILKCWPNGRQLIKRFHHSVSMSANQNNCLDDIENVNWRRKLLRVTFHKDRQFQFKKSLIIFGFQHKLHRSYLIIEIYLWHS